MLGLSLGIYSMNSYHHHLHHHFNLFQPFFNNFSNYFSLPTFSSCPQSMSGQFPWGQVISLPVSRDWSVSNEVCQIFPSSSNYSKQTNKTKQLPPCTHSSFYFVIVTVLIVFSLYCCGVCCKSLLALFVLLPQLIWPVLFSSVQLLSCVQLFVTPWTAAPTPGAYSNSCPLSRWCHPTILSSVVPFSSRL